ncbi:MAG: AAA family ATPase [Bacillota bacterium]
MIKEISIGLVIAGILFLALVGYDIVPILFLGGAGLIIFWIARSRGLISKTFAGTQAENIPKITFGDIGGQASAIQELKEALDFIRNHKEIQRLGIRPLKGILLTGPPGTGKTLLARAAARYTEAMFVACSGSEFVEMYAGVGAQRVRKLFSTAREKAKRQNKTNALIFIDEVDILGARRGQHSSHHEYDQTLNQLLVEMDGLEMDGMVRLLVVAATNRVDMLDPALLRPGRFDRVVKVDLPDRDGRMEILRLHTGNKPMDEDVQLEVIAKETFGFSGAHLESVANEAAILAMREGCARIAHRHFHEAIDKVMMGDKLDRRPVPAEMRRIAIHEVGHALISEMTRYGSVSTLTVIPRGQAMGYMRQTPEDDTYLYTKEQMENQIAVMLAGSLAEEMMLGNRSTGATNDFEHAVKTAQQIIRSGLSELGVVDYDNMPPEVSFEVQRSIIREQEERVRRELTGYRAELDKVVQLLLEEEKISGDRFRKEIMKSIQESGVKQNFSCKRLVNC